jgi:hypothetical protein
MKDNIVKWWNRKWSNWEHYGFEEKQVLGNTVGRYEVLVKKSNDGLVKYKVCKIINAGNI